MAKKAKLADIVNCCEERFNRGASLTWKHSDFVDLNREILRDTEVNISPNTLKRIFGKISVDDEYSPQQATIDALIKYGGYSLTEAEGIERRKSEEQVIDKKPSRTKSFKWLLIPAIIIILVFVAFALGTFKSRPNEMPGAIKLKTIEGLLPATAFFELQLPGNNDSLFVDFGDKSSLLYVKAGQKSTAHNYLYPGVFRVSLKAGQTTLATTNVSIRTSKWIGLAYPPHGTLPNRYYNFPPDKTGNDSLFHISNSLLHEVGIDTIGMFYTRLCNFAPIKHSGEDFAFETTFKNALPGKGISCIGTQFQISGINGSIRFKLVNSGCSYRVINVVSEQIFDGRIENLSQFVIDLEKWNTVKLTNRNKHLSLFVNDKLLFTGTYKQSLGGIQGLFLEFEGNGFVKNCTLKSYDGKTLYGF